jgi:hypothetical protein
MLTDTTNNTQSEAFLDDEKLPLECRYNSFMPVLWHKKTTIDQF